MMRKYLPYVAALVAVVLAALVGVQLGSSQVPECPACPACQEAREVPPAEPQSNTSDGV